MSLDDQPTALYRFFDGDDQLIYVGISNSALRRIAQHREAKAWFGSCTRVTFEHYPTRAEALEAERRAVAEENPRENILLRARRPSVLAAPRRLGPVKHRYSNRRYGRVRESSLFLYPEIDGSSCVDDCDSDDGFDQLDYFVDRVREWWPDKWEADAVPISWFVRSDAGENECEFAPFTNHPVMDGRNFLDYFTWPVDIATGEPIDWFKLPIRNERFPEFAKALDWTPSPFQPHCPLRSLIYSREGVRPIQRKVVA